jgi:hypothetical protein
LSPKAPTLYRSSGQHGYLPQITADARRVVARKLERAVQVRFTDTACEVHTREGIVKAKPGDAIITGTGGEQWRVSRTRFAEKYRPQPPLAAGLPGVYLSLKYWIHAVPMKKSFEVLLADGESRLSGRAGDWLVDYGDGSLGVVSPAIFATTYEILDRRARAERGPMALHQFIQRLLLTGADLDLPAAPAAPNAPAALQPLIDAVEEPHRVFDARALVYGHRYRSGFWAIYLLSAVAVLCAMLPLALGWDSSRHNLHTFAGLWALNEVVLIGTVTAIYWLGHRRDWQGQWLHARTTAELTWYLPMLAPLLDPTAPESEPNWYQRVFDPGHHLRDAGDVTSLCIRCEPLVHVLQASGWSDQGFVSGYGQWSIEILEQQRHYHHRNAIKQHALLHRVHRLNGALFGLTAVGALMHLVLHSLWLSLITTFFPALGASETYRVGATSERLVVELGGAIARIRAALEQPGLGSDFAPARAAIKAAMALLLEEHQNWHLLVRPHDLPLH